MKVSTKLNPHNVQIGQVWKRAKRKDRPNKFKVVSFAKTTLGVYAIVEYIKSKIAREINLLRFNEYQLTK